LIENLIFGGVVHGVRVCSNVCDDGCEQRAVWNAVDIEGIGLPFQYTHHSRESHVIFA
jgi:hypothetical protein